MNSQRGLICGSPQCLGIPSGNSPFCFRCLRKWSGRALPKIDVDDSKLYIIAGGDLVKIGTTSRSVRGRMATMQTGSPIPLTLIGFVPCSSHWETSAHKLLSQHRTRGEWFRREGKVLQLIEWVEKKDHRSIQSWINSSWASISHDVLLRDKSFA